MNKAWFSYVVLSVGLMLLVASDERANADDKEVAHSINFGEQGMEVFISRDGDSDANVDLVIDGKKLSFTLPELKDGAEPLFIKTEDGGQIKVQSISGNKMIWVDGIEMQLPAEPHKIAPNGLSTMISRTHNIKMADEVSISAPDMDDDVKAAMVSAIESVLMSYDIKKKVSVKDNNLGLLRLVNKDSLHNMDANVKFEFKTDNKEMKANNLILIKSKSDDENGHVIHIDTDENNQ